MRQRARKFIGMILLVGFVIVYAFFAMAIASMTLPELSRPMQILYYVVAGFLWVLPCLPLITWMQRPDKRSPDRRSPDRR